MIESRAVSAACWKSRDGPWLWSDLVRGSLVNNISHPEYMADEERTR